MVARRQASDVVEFELGPHRSRPGWQQVLIAYDYHNPKHRRQIDMVLDALIKARHAVAPEADDEQGGQTP